MKIKIYEPKEIEIKRLKMSVAVRYGEEDMPNDFPFRKNDIWSVFIDLDEKRIIDWPKGVKHEFCMKICDEGSYYLLNENNNVIKARENEYVPNNLLPGEHGDYLEFDIDENGIITNWLNDASFDDFDDENERLY